MQLKTLQDLVIWLRDYNLDKVIENAKNNKGSDCVVRLEDLKAEVIKWVKEDKDLEVDQERTMVVSLKSILIERWMKRLNITEEDLK